MTVNQDQLRARLFTLSTARGPEWGLDYTEDIMRRFGESAWVFCCGAEMLLRNQLPERAASLQPTEDDESCYRLGDSYHQFLESTVDNAEYNAWLDHIHTPRAEDY